MIAITVGSLLKDEGKELKLKLASGKFGIENKIFFSEINRPGLALSGYFGYFAYQRVQVLGKTEFSYLHKMNGKLRARRIQKMFSYKVPCVITTNGLVPFKEMLNLSEERSIPILRTNLNTQELIHKITFYLESKFTPSTTLHGDLVEVYGVGVLILGKSGVGKSETALELIQRGHRLIADDVISINREPGRTLSGGSNSLIKHHVEIRGLGIIDIKNLFGTRAIRDKKRIELVVQLEEWKENKLYDRLGLKEKICKILGVPLPKIVIPVRPGRNLAIIIEVAVMNYRLKKMGVFSARELSKELKKNMKEKK